MEGEQPPLRGVLSEIDRALRELRPEVFRSLRPGLAHAALRDAWGREMPPEVVELWSWHDGQDSEEPLVVGTNWSLLSAADSHDVWATINAEPSNEIGPWRQDWIPVLENGAGDYLVFDRVTGALLEYWHEDHDRPVAYESLLAWARFVASSVRSPTPPDAARDDQFDASARLVVTRAVDNPSSIAREVALLSGRTLGQTMVALRSGGLVAEMPTGLSGSEIFQRLTSMLRLNALLRKAGAGPKFYLVRSGTGAEEAVDVEAVEALRSRY